MTILMWVLIAVVVLGLIVLLAKLGWLDIIVDVISDMFT